MKHILGISAGYHDAAIAVVNSEGEIVFAGHSERYSKLKNDANICPELMQEVCDYPIDTIAYYERPWAKQLRRLYSGEGVEWNRLTVKQNIKEQLAGWLVDMPKHIRSYNHHLSHAAGGFQTSPFDRATVVVIDAVGEFDTISIWAAEYDSQGQAQYRRLWGQRYPHSIGLFYSAITERVGLRPLDEEYITMGMAAYGKQASVYAHTMRQLLVDDAEQVRFLDNLHTGVGPEFMYNTEPENLAGAAQIIAEELITAVMRRAQGFGFSTNLVYSGGVALNCVANRLLGERFENIWIMPSPGDSGSAIGCAALAHGGRIHWSNAFLGRNIPGDYPVDAIIDSLLSDRICGVASGRAEFGPRALGNRSLLADPRGNDIKDLVNLIKRRQQFRPFAPVILEEHVDDYFVMPPGFTTSAYMQTVAQVRRPDLFPAIAHADDTARVQTVGADGSGIRRLLEAWYGASGCPMLLNTSLNIRGEPMVNDRADAIRFEKLYGIAVHS